MSSMPSAKVAVLKLRTRVAAGFFQFSEDVLDRRQAEALVDEGSFGSSCFSAALSPISARTSRPQAATIFLATP
jgi:hypothetical protein